MQHFFATVNFALTTGDTNLVRELSEPDCGSCIGVATEIDKVYDAGGSVKTAGWEVRKINFVGKAPDHSRTVVAINLHQPDEMRLNSSDAKPIVTGAATVKVDVYLVRSSDHWIVNEFTLRSDK